MGFCATVPDALRHGVGLVPYKILPQIPPISPQGKGQKPRDPHQVLALVASRRLFPGVPVCVPGVCRWLRPGPGGVAVPDVHPQRPVLAQNPPDLPEHTHQLGYVLLRRFLHADLPGCPVVPQIVIGRGGHAGVDAFRLQCPQLLQGVTAKDRFHCPPPPGPETTPGCSAPPGGGSFPRRSSPPNRRRNRSAGKARPTGYLMRG